MSTHIRLKDAFKKETRDQDKVIHPRETIRRLREKLDHLNLHILDHTERIDNGRLDIPVFFSYCGPDGQAMTGTKKQMGKGATPDQAEASAVMELAERFSLYSFRNNPANFKVNRRPDLKDRAVSFKTIARSVHDDSEDLDTVQEIFDALPLRWTEGYNLTRERPVLIPFDWFFTINEFNGACAGNQVEEALCQGICEVVERHVSARIARNRWMVPSIRPESASDPVVADMLDKYRRAGIEVNLSDFTLDTGIPSVGVLAWDPATFPDASEIVWTAGTAPNPVKALGRALSETAQLAGDFNTGSNYLASGLPKFSRIEEADFIRNPEAQKDVTDLPDLSDPNIKVEIQRLLDALRKRNMEVLAVNTTHPRLEVPAFYTIIPGAHFRQRAANQSVGMFCAKLITENYSPETAILQLKEMDRKLPGKYYVQFYLGTAHLGADNPEIARGYLESALASDPAEEDIPSIYSYLGVCLKEMEHYREALDVLRKGIAVDSDRTDLHNLAGFCHFKLKEHEQAIESFQEVLRLNPSSGIDYANIATNYRELGDREKAVAYYQMALEIDPSLDFARENLHRLTAAS
jgi:ribosomal protein S12 methylthiotransferase accessory factor